MQLRVGKLKLSTCDNFYNVLDMLSIARNCGLRFGESVVNLSHFQLVVA